MSTKRQNQKEKQKIMQIIQEHNNLVADIPKMLTSEVGESQKQFQNDFLTDTNEIQNIEKEINFEQIEQFAQITNNNLIEINYPQKFIDLTTQQDCKKIQKQNVQSKQSNDLQQFQEIQNPSQQERKTSQKQSKESKIQNTLNEEIKVFEERIIKYTSEVSQELKLSPRLSEEWKKKFTLIKKKK